MPSIISRALPPAALLATLLVSGCNSHPTVITGGGPADPTANQIAAAPPVKLPPALVATKTYRCKDNSLVYIDWFNDNMTANLKVKKKDADAHHLTAEAAGQPFSGDGYQLTGTPTSASVTYKDPKGGGQSCDG